MKIFHPSIEGLMILQPEIAHDHRGLFLEVFHQDKYTATGLPNFVQDNISHSKKNVLRGLHFQADPHAQGKLVMALTGEIWDVAVDIRPHSPTFGQWHGVILNAQNFQQFYIPPGFAHGFCVLSDYADVLYKCTQMYMPTADRGLAWDDPDLKINWPVTDPILSAKDQNFSGLKTLHR